MKKLFLPGFLTLTLILSISAVGAKKPLIIQLLISQTTTQADLDRQIEFMKANGYDFTIDYVRYNEKGGVEAICGEVDFKKGSGSFEADDLGGKCIVIKKGLLGQMSIQFKSQE